MSRKIWMRLSGTPGRGAFQDSGMPAALIALNVKKTKNGRDDRDEVAVDLETAEKTADDAAL